MENSTFSGHFYFREKSTRKSYVNFISSFWNPLYQLAFNGLSDVSYIFLIGNRAFSNIVEVKPQSSSSVLRSKILRFIYLEACKAETINVFSQSFVCVNKLDEAILSTLAFVYMSTNQRVFQGSSINHIYFFENFNPTLLLLWRPFR